MASPERVSLRYGDCRAEVLLRGGQICSLRGSDGREAIWQADPAVWPQHAPVLFPVCGSVKHDQVTIEKAWLYPQRTLSGGQAWRRFRRAGVGTYRRIPGNVPL